MRSARQLLLAWLLAWLSSGGSRGDDPASTVSSTTVADKRTSSQITVAPPTLSTVSPTRTDSPVVKPAETKQTTTVKVPVSSPPTTTMPTPSKGGSVRTSLITKTPGPTIPETSAASQKTTSTVSSPSGGSKTSPRASTSMVPGSLTTTATVMSRTSKAPVSATNPSSSTTLQVTTTTKPKSSPDVTAAAPSPASPTSIKSRTAAPAVGSSAVTHGSVTSPKEETTKSNAVSGVSTSQHPRHETMGTVTSPPPKAVSQPPVTHPEALTTTRIIPTSSVPVSPSRPSGSGESSLPAWDEISCEEGVLEEDKTIVLTWNQPVRCKSLQENSLKESLLLILCRAVKPDFNSSRDKCTAKILSDPNHPMKLAVLVVSVQINSEHQELYESLAGRKADLEKIGVNNVTLGERTMDVDTEDRFSMPLIITIVCMATSLLLVAAIYGCCHQRISQRKDQQRLTEELQTMENGYHDNPTLEVMETSSEMQEKKVNLNGELGDSWIVPMDSLMKEDLEEEEDTHL